MGGGHSGLTPEQKHAKKVFDKIKNAAGEIAYGYYETMIAFDDNGDILFKRTDDQRCEVGYGATEEETKKNWALSQDKRCVHNHPQGWTFSDADITLANYHSEIWAVTSERIQIFKWNKNFYHEDSWNRLFSQTKKEAFVEKLQKKYATVARDAERKYYKTHEKPSLSKMSVEEWDKANRRDTKEIVKISQEMMRKFFFNNAKEYGYTYSERKW